MSKFLWASILPEADRMPNTRCYPAALGAEGGVMKMRDCVWRCHGVGPSLHLIQQHGQRNS